MIAVVGSVNIDLVFRAEHLLRPGETLTATEFATFAGGKGANQAVAAAKLGAQVAFVGKVGRDGYGERLAREMKGAGVDTSRLLISDSQPTGIASIVVSPSGENSIVVAAGANGAVEPREVSSALEVLNPDVVLTQFEIPLDATKACIGSRYLIVNPAPARPLDPELAGHIDVITPNETEAEALTGIYPRDDTSCLRAGRLLLDRGVKNVIFTLGRFGSFLVTPQEGRHFPSIEVKAIDSTGAGDAFNGALAHFLAPGRTLAEAIPLANIVGALSATRAGAQASMPTMDEVRLHAPLPH